MSDELLPYTVSGVVDTATGEPVEPLHVAAGHEDYDDFNAGHPLAVGDQFRWAHVAATTAAEAAATDALSADLRPGGDRSAPQARALHGETGLKRYTVVAAVRRGTGRPIGDPVTLPGHLDLGAAFEGRWWQRADTTRVWAVNEAAAVEQVYGTGRAARSDPNITTQTRGAGAAAGAAAVSPAAGGAAAAAGPAGPVVAAAAVGQLAAAAMASSPRALADAAARREWQRLADAPAADRVALVADTVWQYGYPPAYRAAYTDAASQIAAAATSAAQSNRHAWLPLHHLAAAAGDAISRVSPGQPPAPPADHTTLTAAHTAAVTPGEEPAWRRVADAAWTRAQTAGTLHGSLTAATDTLIGWRGRAGDALAGQVAINGRPGRAWVADLLSTVNQAAVPAASRVGGAAARTAAQLAGEDQAPGVPAVTAPAGGRPRPTGSAAPAAAASPGKAR